MTKKRKLPLLEMPIWKALLILSIPIVITNMLQVAYQFADAYWVGRLWHDGVATVTVAGMIIFLTISLGSWLSIAGSILIAQYFWAKNEKMVNHTAAQTLLMILLTSSFLWGLWYIFTPQIVSLIWVDSAIFAQTVEYIRISFIGVIFSFSFFMFQSIMRWIGKPNVPIFIVWLTVLINFLLNPVFIFGFWNFEWLWVIWAAITTVISQAIATVIGFSMLLSGKYGIHLHIKDFIPDTKAIKKSFFLWLPSSIEMTARSGSYALLVVIVTMFGTLALAWFGVAGNIIQFIIIFSMWLSMATSVLVGQSVGAGMIQKAKEINKISAWISFILLTLLGWIAFLFAPYFIWFFVPGEEEVIKIWSEIVRISALFFGLIWIQMSLNGVLRAIGKTQIPMFITILWQWGIKLPLAYILAHYTSLWMQWIWWSEPITSIIICIVMFVIISKVDWSKSNMTKEEQTEKQIIEESIIEEPIKEF